MRMFSIILLTIMVILSIEMVSSAYNQRLDNVVANGQTNLENAVVWKYGEAVIDSGIMDDLSSFTVDYLYLGQTINGGIQNYRNFKNQIAKDYSNLIGLTELQNTSMAIFIDDKLVYINGGTTKYDGKQYPYQVILIYDPIYLGFFTLPNYDIYVTYNVTRAKFQTSKLGFIVNATNEPAYGVPKQSLSNGYCIYVQGTLGNGTICYSKRIKLPYIVETQHKWGGYAIYLYYGELRELKYS